MRSLVPFVLLLAGLLAADATSNEARVGRLLAGRVVAVGESAIIPRG